MSCLAVTGVAPLDVLESTVPILEPPQRAPSPSCAVSALAGEMGFKGGAGPLPIPSLESFDAVLGRTSALHGRMMA